VLPDKNKRGAPPAKKTPRAARPPASVPVRAPTSRFGTLDFAARKGPLPSGVPNRAAGAAASAPVERGHQVRKKTGRVR